MIPTLNKFSGSWKTVISIAVLLISWMIYSPLFDVLFVLFVLGTAGLFLHFVGVRRQVALFVFVICSLSNPGHAIVAILGNCLD